VVEYEKDLAFGDAPAGAGRRNRNTALMLSNLVSQVFCRGIIQIPRLDLIPRDIG